MMITALGVGFITPSPGLNLFAGAGATRESILNIAARVVLSVFFMRLVALMIAYLFSSLHDPVRGNLPVGKREHRASRTYAARD